MTDDEGRRRIKDLQLKIRELEEIKEDLQCKLKSATQFAALAAAANGSSSSEKELTSKIIAYQQNIGILPKIVENGEVRIIFNTNYNSDNGKPAEETFYLQLCCQKGNTKVSRHNLPPFLPIDNLIQQRNSNEIKLPRVMSEVQAYLLAYTQRKTQTEEISVQFPETTIEQVSANDEFSLVQLIMVITNTPISIHLVYKNILSSCPTKIRCSDTGSLCLTKTIIRQSFMSSAPVKAIQDIVLAHQSFSKGNI